jgi:NAD(P)H-quinone oxidoreductase subunit 5
VKVAVQGMAQGHRGVQPVAVSATLSHALKIAGVFELSNDALRCALGDAHQLGDIPQSDIRIFGDAQQHVSVIGEESPVRHAASLSSTADSIPKPHSSYCYPDLYNVLYFSCFGRQVNEGDVVIGLVLMITALTAAPAAVVAGGPVGRLSADTRARAAASITGVGWLATVFLGVLQLTVPAWASLGSFAVPGLRIDALAIVMLLLVLGLSSLIQFFAVRYLRGDRRQMWFVVTANLMTASTVVMVCASTVLVFGLAWVGAGASLVGMLATYRQLPQALDGVRRTALRLLIGDLSLAAAVALLMIIHGGDILFADLGRTLRDAPTGVMTAVAVLLVIPALARSSQVPFHGWLPATLAAPTPVSALLHAGVVNAGAILILRFSPVIGGSRWGMSLIFCAGAVTLVYASVVRLVKPDVKGRLVFSTMAQMGFMMLACGLGAFAAAVLHLIAHGLFKSALFLGAGSGVARSAKQRSWPARRPPGRIQATAAVVLSLGVPIAAIFAARSVLNIELSTASQALQFFVVFTAGVALGTTLWANFTPATVVLGGLAITVLAFGYSALVGLFDAALTFQPVTASVDVWWLLLPGGALLAMQVLLLPTGSGNPLVRRLYPLVLAAGTPTPRRRAQVPLRKGVTA